MPKGEPLTTGYTVDRNQSRSNQPYSIGKGFADPTPKEALQNIRSARLDAELFGFKSKKVRSGSIQQVPREKSKKEDVPIFRATGSLDASTISLESYIRELCSQREELKAKRRAGYQVSTKAFEKINLAIQRAEREVRKSRKEENK